MISGKSNQRDLLQFLAFLVLGLGVFMLLLAWDVYRVDEGSSKTRLTLDKVLGAVFLVLSAGVGYWKFVRQRVFAERLILTLSGRIETIGEGKCLHLLDLEIHNPGNVGLVIDRMEAHNPRQYNGDQGHMQAATARIRPIYAHENSDETNVVVVETGEILKRHFVFEGNPQSLASTYSVVITSDRATRWEVACTLVREAKA